MLDEAVKSEMKQQDAHFDAMCSGVSKTLKELKSWNTDSRDGKKHSVRSDEISDAADRALIDLAAIVEKAQRATKTLESNSARLVSGEAKKLEGTLAGRCR